MRGALFPHDTEQVRSNKCGFPQSHAPFDDVLLLWYFYMEICGPANFGKCSQVEFQDVTQKRIAVDSSVSISPSRRPQLISCILGIPVTRGLTQSKGLLYD